MLNQNTEMSRVSPTTETHLFRSFNNIFFKDTILFKITDR